MHTDREPVLTRADAARMMQLTDAALTDLRRMSEQVSETMRRLNATRATLRSALTDLERI